MADGSEPSMPIIGASALGRVCEQVTENERNPRVHAEARFLFRGRQKVIDIVDRELAQDWSIWSSGLPVPEGFSWINIAICDIQSRDRALSHHTRRMNDDESTHDGVSDMADERTKERQTEGS